MENKNKDWFLAVKKKNQGLGLKAIDLLILSQIEEFQRKGESCFVANETFASMFGESISTVKRSIDRLEKFNIIRRNTVGSRDEGKGKKRTLVANDRSKWKIPTKVHIEPWSDEGDNTTKVHIEPWSEDTKVHIEPWSENQGSNIDVPRFKSDSTKVHIEPIKDKEKKKEKINNGHCVPLETTPSASSETLPTVASTEKKNKVSKKGSNPIVEEISKHCDCSASEIEGIVNDNGLDYDALLHCVENGYIDGENLYSKKHWESMDIDDVLRDPTYEEYLASMYKSNPDGLDEVKAKKSNVSIDNNVDDCLASDDADVSINADDMSWLDGLADWAAE